MTSFARLLVLSALLISFSSVTLLGQDSTKSSIQTVFKKNKGIAKLNYLGVYIAPEYQFGQVGGIFTSLAGGSVMLQFNKRFAVGMTGYGSFRNQSIGVDGMFGGLKFEYTVKPDAAIHVSFPLIIGMAVIIFILKNTNMMILEMKEMMIMTRKLEISEKEMIDSQTLLII